MSVFKSKDQKLISAIIKENLEKVKRLLSSGADANAKDRNGLTAMMCVIRRGYSEMAELLKLTARRSEVLFA